jgi:hypothetical protein
LSRALEEFAEERFRASHSHLEKAKALAPRATTIRELLGLTAYYLERWEESLRELRAFRRMSGETTQMPVEMDCLRALGRPSDVDKTWSLFRELGGDRETDREARVVYASHLLDRGRVREAWHVIKPGRLVEQAPPNEVRRWFVAARVALAAGDAETGRRLVEAIRRRQPDLPGLDDLAEAISTLSVPPGS